MKSTDRILTTHVGSLPRPQAVVDLLFAQDRGDAIDAKQFDETIRAAVADAVEQASEKPAWIWSAMAKWAKSATPPTSGTA